MKLVANGCSHTCGAEIEHVLQRRCYDKAWPKYLADKLDCDHVNLADSGASCHRVVRTTMRYVLDNVKDLHDHLFVINWPGAFRTEYRFSDSFKEDKHNFYDDLWAPLVVGNDELYKKQMSRKLYTAYQSWVVSNTPINAYMDYMHHIILLQNLFMLFKVKFLFWEAAHVNVPRTRGELTGYKSLIIKKTFPHFGDVNHVFTSLLSQNGQKISDHSIEGGQASHYDEEGQRWFADYMHNELAKRSII